jgi:hypothetical protein
MHKIYQAWGQYLRYSSYREVITFGALRTREPTRAGREPIADLRTALNSAPREIMQKFGYGPAKRLSVTVSTRDVSYYRDPPSS